jgi:hypothetical protein
MSEVSGDITTDDIEDTQKIISRYIEEISLPDKLKNKLNLLLQELHVEAVNKEGY